MAEAQADSAAPADVAAVPLPESPPPPEAKPEDLNDGYGDLAFRPPTSADPDGSVGALTAPGIPVRELVDQRQSNVEVWEMTDGSRQMRVFSDAKYFQPIGTDEWVPVDSHLVPDPNRPGWFRNAANSWQVSFGPIEPASTTPTPDGRMLASPTAMAVEIATADGQRLAFNPERPSMVADDPTDGEVEPSIDDAERAPSGADAGGPSTEPGSATTQRPPADRLAITPVIGADGTSVTYADVWPNVDLTYHVRGDEVKEEIVIHRGATLSSFGFSLAGDKPQLPQPTPEAGEPATSNGTAGQARQQADGAAASITLGGVSVDTNNDAVDNVTSGAGVTYDFADGVNTGRADISVDPNWLAGLPGTAFPVVVDPLVQPVLPAAHYYSYPTVGSPCGSDSYTYCGQLRVGTDTLSSGAPTWISMVNFNYTPYYWSSFGTRNYVVDGTLSLTPQSGSSGPTELDTYWARSFGWPASDWIQAATGSANLTQVAQVNVQPVLNAWLDLLDPSTTGYFGLSSSADFAYTYKTFVNPQLSMTLDGSPTAPGLAGWAPGATSLSATPRLSTIGATDPEGQSLRYLFRVASSPDGSNGGWIGDSGLLPAGTTSWTPPLSMLGDGRTYYWTAYAFDGHSYSAAAPWREIKINQRLGAGGPSPTDSFGPATVNLANGNLAVAVTTPTVATVGGSMGVELSYNSELQPDAGLRGTYSNDANGNNLFDDPVLLTRNDASVQFDWGTGSPGASLLGDAFMVRWQGYITFPSDGNWRFQIQADDGMRLTVNGQQLLNEWPNITGSNPRVSGYFNGALAGHPYPITIDYREGIGSAFAFVAVAKGTAAFQNIPTAWLSTSPDPFGQGWSLAAGGVGAPFTQAIDNGSSITLTGAGGDTVEFKATADGAGYAPPPGVDAVMSVVGSGTGNGKIVTVQDVGGYSYEYDLGLGGRLVRAQTITVPGHPTATVYEYDASGRLFRLRDPVSTPTTGIPSATRRVIELVYAPNAGCQNNPPPGALCALKYPDGSQTNLTYDQGRLAAVSSGNLTDGLDITQFKYNAAGLLSGIRQPLATEMVAATPSLDPVSYWEFSYGSLGVSQITAPRPTPTATRDLHNYTYDPANYRATVSDPSADFGAGSRDVTYDGSGRAVSTSHIGLTTTVTYDGVSDRVASVTDPAGLRTTMIYNYAGWPGATWGPAPASWFGANGVPTSHDTEIAHTLTDFDEHDQGVPYEGLGVTWWNNPNLICPISGMNTGLEERADGQLNWSWGAGVPVNSGVTNVDSFSGRFTGTVIFPTPGTWWIGGIRNGKMSVWIDDVQVADGWVDGDGQINTPRSFTTTQYSENHRIRVDVADTGGVFGAVLQWKGPGVPTWTTVPGPNLQPRYGLPTTTMTYTSATSSDTTLMTYVGPEYRLPETQTKLGGSGQPNSTTTTGYDFGGTTDFYLRPSVTFDPGNVSGTEYDYWGDQVTKDDPCVAGTSLVNQGGFLRYLTEHDPLPFNASVEGLRHEYVYDAMGRTVAHQARGQDGTTTGAWECTVYDARGRVKSTTDRANHPSVMTYATGAVLTAYMDSAGAVRYTYASVDMLGRPTQYINESGDLFETTYDTVGRPKEQYRTRVGETTHRLMVRNNYDPYSGRLASVEDYGGATVATTTYTYDGYGRPSTTTEPNNVVATTNYSTGTGGVDSVGYSRNSLTQATSSVGRDRSGRVTSDSLVDTAGGRTLTRTYGFDHIGRLTSATDSGNVSTATRNYSYFQNSNRCSDTPTCPLQAPYVYDNADRITASPTYSSFTYDNWGNMTGATPRVTTPGIERIADTKVSYTTGQAQPAQTWPVLVGSAGTFSATILTGGGTSALVLRNSGGTAVTMSVSGTNPKTYTATLPIGAYTLEVQSTGTGTAIVNNVSWPAAAPRLIIAYDANDHATTIDDGTYNTVETLDPNGTVLRRQVWHIPTGTLVEDTTYAYSGPGDTPAYTVRAGTVTNYGPEGAVHTATTSTWPIVNLHGDIIATYDRNGARTAVALTNEFGISYTPDLRDPRDPSNRLGWLGAARRFEVSPTVGIIRMGRRLYLPTLGRFLQDDPILGGSCTAYDYACGDPVNGLDLDGTSSFGGIHKRPPPASKAVPGALARPHPPATAFKLGPLHKKSFGVGPRRPMPNDGGGGGGGIGGFFRHAISAISTPMFPADLVSNLYQRYSVDFGGCFVLCAAISFGGGKPISISVGGVGIMEFGPTVSYHQKPVSDGLSECVYIGVGPLAGACSSLSDASMTISGGQGEGVMYGAMYTWTVDW